MKIWILFLLVMVASAAHAFIVTTNIQQSQQGEIRRAFWLQCAASEDLCQNICNKESSCFLNFESCEGCASSSNLKLISTFLHLSQFYNAIPRSGDVSQLSVLLRSQRFTILDYDSIFNLLSDAADSEQTEKSRLEFLRLCPVSSQESFVIADSDFTPQLVVCQTSSQAQVFPVRPNPQFFRQAPLEGLK